MVFQQEPMADLQSMTVCKSHTMSAEMSLDLIYSNYLILNLVVHNGS